MGTQSHSRATLCAGVNRSETCERSVEQNRRTQVKGREVEKTRGREGGGVKVSGLTDV